MRTEGRPCGDTARRRPRTSQRERPQEEPTLAALWSGASSLQDCEETKGVVRGAHSVVLCRFSLKQRGGECGRDHASSRRHFAGGDTEETFVLAHPQQRSPMRGSLVGGGAFAQAKPHPYSSPPKLPLGLSFTPSSQCSGQPQTPRGAPCPPCVFICQVAGAGVTTGALPGYRGDDIGRQLPELPRRLPDNLAASPQLGTSLPTFF